MKIQEKVKIAVGLTLLVPVVYYFIYAFVDLYLSQLCKTYICFEFPPFADVLAIWVALIGLYFVVTSLEAWKNQDKYQTAKNNIRKIHDILDMIKIFNQEMKNLNGMIKKDCSIGSKFVMNEDKDIEYQNAYRFQQYEQYLNELKILDLIKDTKYAITKQSMNLYQQKFEEVIEPYRVCRRLFYLS